MQNIYKSYFDKKIKKILYAVAGLMYARLADEDRIQKIDEVINTYSGDPIVELALHDKFIYYY